MNIDSKDLMQNLQSFVESEKGSPDYHKGMESVMQYIREYLNETPDFFNEGFQKFALSTFLNGDSSQLPKLANIVQLFLLLNKDVEPLTSWSDGPNGLDGSLCHVIEGCLEGLTVSDSMDWDHEYIKLILALESATEEVVSLDSYGYLCNEVTDEKTNIRVSFNEFCNLISLDTTFETMYIYILLLKGLQYFNEDKVQSALRNF